MAIVKSVKIEDLQLDLENYRTTKQQNEVDLIKSMIAISPGKFFGVLESIINDGFLLNENLVIQKRADSFIVKEGNRRVASLKIALGLHKVDDFAFSNPIKERVKSLSKEWKKNHNKVPCGIYDEDEKDQVNRIVNLTHGKGQRASRDPWAAIAKARYNRDENNGREPGLSILESFLEEENDLTNEQVYKWSGTFPITVLDEAVKKAAPALGYKNAPNLASQYPNIEKKDCLNNLIKDIGFKKCKFTTIRQEEPNFLDKYALRNTKQDETTPSSASTRTNSIGNPQTNPGTKSEGTKLPSSSNSQSTDASNPSKPDILHKAVSNTNLRNVKDLLKDFAPSGQNRQKVVAIREEMLRLNIRSTPIAFCFLLRGIFEISAKAYCKDYNIKTTNNSGHEKKLVDILRKATSHMTNDNSNQTIVKELHGAMTEIAKPDGILSITSLNQLVHNPNFSISPTDIAILFSNIFPLLKKLN